MLRFFWSSFVNFLTKPSMFRQIVEIWRSQIVFLGGNTMKVAIFGAGTMGRGIAQVFAANGHTALMYASGIKSSWTHLCRSG